MKEDSFVASPDTNRDILNCTHLETMFSTTSPVQVGWSSFSYNIQYQIITVTVHPYSQTHKMIPPAIFMSNAQMPEAGTQILHSSCLVPIFGFFPAYPEQIYPLLVYMISTLKLLKLKFMLHIRAGIYRLKWKTFCSWMLLWQSC
jgi:hypothetical protein